MLEAIEADIHVRSGVSDVAALSPAYMSKSAVLLALHQPDNALQWAVRAVEACLGGSKLDTLLDATVAAAVARDRHEARRLVLALLHASKVQLSQATAAGRASLTRACTWATAATPLCKQHQLARELATEVRLVHRSVALAFSGI